MLIHILLGYFAFNFVCGEIFSRTRHVAVPAGTDDAILFGGVTPETGQAYNDIWTYRVLENVWEPFEAIGDVPDPRAGASATLINTDFWLLYGGTDERQTFDDIYLFCIPTATWLRGVKVSFRRIPARADHAAATDGSGNIYVFGGVSRGGHRLDDLWSISLLPDTLSNRGEDVSVDVQRFSNEPKLSDSELQVFGDLPSARSGHSMTFIKDAIYVFGGSTATTPNECAELYTLVVSPQRVATWTKLKQSSPCPAPREGHAAVRHGHTLLILGGCNTLPAVLKCYNDLWQYDTDTHTWRDLRNAVQSYYSPRMGHSATFLSEGRLLLTGGSRLDFQSFGALPPFSLSSGCPSDCSNGQGRCSPDKYCICKEEFFEHDCGAVAFIGTSNTDHALCHHHGIMQLDGRCECYLGYHGSACEFGENNCLNNCSGHGRCNAQSQCECDPGYIDSDCSFLATCPNLCCNKGRCEASGQCTCHTHHYGASCTVTSLQIAEMRQTMERVRGELLKLVSQLDEMRHLSEQRLANLPHESSSAAKTESAQLEAHLLDTQERLQQQLSLLELERSDDMIAMTYFREAQCVSVPQPQLLSSVLPTPEELAPEQALRQPKNKGPLSSGQTSYEQNQLAIERSRREGRTNHVLPPDPRGIAIEDIYAAAEQQLHQQQPLHRQQLLPVSLPVEELGGVTPIELSPLETARVELKLFFTILFSCAGLASSYGVYYTNVHLLKRQHSVRLEDDHDEIMQLVL